MTTRVALITGCGKRDGMGRAIANTLAASGVAVVVTDKQPAGVLNRRQEVVGGADESWGGVDSLVEEITSAGGTAMAQLGDISVVEDAQRMVDAAAAWRGRLDILVNVAGAPQGLDRQDIEDVPIEAFDRQIAVNLRGTFLMSRFAVPHMRAQRWGRIINISSQAGQVAAAMSTAYSASKAGILGFTRALSADVAPWGITVNAIAPGMVATSRAMLSLDPNINVDAEIKRRGSMLAVGRSGYPEDIAAAVAYLASDGAGYMTGQTLVLDGGGSGVYVREEATRGGEPRGEEMTMAPRTTPPFRADHVGSLLRPAELHAARADRAAGRITADELRAVEDEAIRDAVAMQQLVGLRSVTDGEFRRATWHMDFIYQIGGIERAPGTLLSTFHNTQGDITFTPDAIQVTRPLSVDKTIFGDDFAFLQSIAGDSVPKLTIPAASMVHYRSGIRAVVTEDIYPDVESFWSDLGAAYNAEVQRLAAQGCRYLQLDDTSLAYVNDPSQREYIAARGEDAESHSPPVHQPDQRGGRRAAGRHGDHHAPVPRQLPVLVGGVRRLRLRGRGAVQRARRGRLLPRIRRRAVRRLRAAALRAAWQASGAGPGNHEAAGA